LLHLQTLQIALHILSYTFNFYNESDAKNSTELEALVKKVDAKIAKKARAEEIKNGKKPTINKAPVTSKETHVESEHEIYEAINRSYIDNGFKITSKIKKGLYDFVYKAEPKITSQVTFSDQENYIHLYVYYLDVKGNKVFVAGDDFKYNDVNNINKNLPKVIYDLLIKAEDNFKKYEKDNKPSLPAEKIELSEKEGWTYVDEDLANAIASFGYYLDYKNIDSSNVRRMYFFDDKTTKKINIKTKMDDNSLYVQIRSDTPNGKFDRKYELSFKSSYKEDLNKLVKKNISVLLDDLEEFSKAKPKKSYSSTNIDSKVSSNYDKEKAEIDLIIPKILLNCSKAVDMFKNNKVFVRGMGNKKETTFEIPEITYKRKPADTPYKIDEFVEQFRAKFFDNVASRQHAAYCVFGNKTTDTGYGNEYFAFPTNKCKFFQSKTIADFYQSVPMSYVKEYLDAIRNYQFKGKDIDDDKLVDKAMKIIKTVGAIDTDMFEFYKTSIKKYRKICIKELKKYFTEANTTIDTMDDKKEVVFQGDYYLIKIEVIEHDTTKTYEYIKSKLGN